MANALIYIKMNIDQWADENSDKVYPSNCYICPYTFEKSLKRGGEVANLATK